MNEKVRRDIHGEWTYCENCGHRVDCDSDGVLINHTCHPQSPHSALINHTCRPEAPHSVAVLRGALMDTAAALSATLALLERYAPFDTPLNDYQVVLLNAQAALTHTREAR